MVVVALSRGPSVPGITRVTRVIGCIALRVRSMVVGFIVSLFPSMSLIINPTDEGRGGRGLGSCVTKGSFNGLLIPLVSGSLLLSLTLTGVPSRLIPRVRIFSRPVSPVVVGVSCVTSFSSPFWPVSLPGFSRSWISSSFVS